MLGWFMGRAGSVALKHRSSRRAGGVAKGFVATTVLGLSLVLSGVAGPAVAQTSPDVARSFMEQMLSEGRESINAGDLDDLKKHNLAHDLVDRAFDLDTMARFVLGGHRRQMNAGQLRDFTNLYHDYLVASYIGRIAEFANRPVTIQDVESYGGNVGDALVNTVITDPDGKDREIGWRVRSKQGNPRILDVVIGGVSFLATQRSEFRSLLGSKGVDGLMDAMETLVDRNTPDGGARARTQPRAMTPVPSSESDKGATATASQAMPAKEEPTVVNAPTRSTDAPATDQANVTTTVAADPAPVVRTPMAPATPLSTDAAATRDEARALKEQMDKLLKSLEK